MTKFTSLERLKNELRSYEEAQLDDSSGSIAQFKPDPNDVRKLIEEHETLVKALAEANERKA